MIEQTEKRNRDSNEPDSRTAKLEIVEPISPERLRSLRNVTVIVYALQAASILVGVTYLAALIVNYIKLKDVRDTWLESHFSWQVRTFWFSLLWGVLGILTMGLGIGYLILATNSAWFIYRIIRGWLNLNDGKEMYL